MWFIGDEKGSLLCSQRFDVKTSTLFNPTILIRSKNPQTKIWDVTGFISAEKATYDFEAAVWNLDNGRFTYKDLHKVPEAKSYYASDIKPKDIPVRRKSMNKALLSFRQLSLLAMQGTKERDQAQLFSQKHFRVTDPIINLIMLLISLPILVCRDPKAMKSAIMISFAATGLCFVTTFICKMLATEVIFSMVIPEFWAWLPIIIFFPIALLELDSMKT